jgi:hypothetical protein
LPVEATEQLHLFGLRSAVAIATTLWQPAHLSAGVNTTKLDAIPSSGDVILLGAVKEKSTGILFPKRR